MSQASTQAVKATTYISQKDEVDDILYFTLKNINTSFANGLRRIILTEIPTLVFKTFPHDENQATITTNTSRFNNEIIKQRLSCIPIHGVTHDQPYDELEVIIDKKNDTHDIQLVTTEDFQIKNIKSGKLLTPSVVRKIFPPDSITGDYIILARLRPRISNEVPGEVLKISAKMSLHMAKEDGAFNIVSCCAYRNSPDKVKQDQVLQEYLKSLPESINHDMASSDWKNHQAARLFQPDSFDFKIQTLGVFSNVEIVMKACNVMNENIQNLADTFTMDNLPNIIQTVPKSTIPNTYDLKLDNVDYTVGKVVECLIHDKYYKDLRTLSYVGFRKNHPHDNHSILRLAFVQGSGDMEDREMHMKIVEILQDVSQQAIGIYTRIYEEFNV